MRAALVLVAVSAVCWADVPPPRVPSLRPVDACRADSDCEVTTFAGCCGGCCPASPRARSSSRLEAERRHCAVVDCSLPSCKGISCEQALPVSDFRAVCRAGACELAPARAPSPAPLAQCQSNADCVVTTDDGCCPGCCPGAAVARSRAEVGAERLTCASSKCARFPCTSKMACPSRRPLSDSQAECRAGSCMLTDAQPADPHPRPPGSCRADSDCVLSTFPGCCGGCCPRPVEAMSRAVFDKDQAWCNGVTCSPPVCNGEPCPDVSVRADAHAVCRAGVCAMSSAAPPPPPPADPMACRSAGDCVITSFACCGSCCPLEPRAESKVALEHEQTACRARPCPMMKPCRPGQCTKETTPLSAFVPACVGGRCVAEPSNATPSFECRVDSECTLTSPQAPPGAPCRSSPCGCCPGEPTAVPASRPLSVPLTRPVPGGAPAPPPGVQPPFGLSEGTTRNGPRPAPQCSPCPSPREAHAACRGGRCVVVPRIERIERR